MSVPLEERWRARKFERCTRGYVLIATQRGSDSWVWSTGRDGKLIAHGTRPDEKAAKLAARRAMERHERGAR